MHRKKKSKISKTKFTAKRKVGKAGSSSKEKHLGLPRNQKGPGILLAAEPEEELGVDPALLCACELNTSSDQGEDQNQSRSSGNVDSEECADISNLCEAVLITQDPGGQLVDSHQTADSGNSEEEFILGLGENEEIDLFSKIRNEEEPARKNYEPRIFNKEVITISSEEKSCESKKVSNYLTHGESLVLFGVNKLDNLKDNKLPDSEDKNKELSTLETGSCKIYEENCIKKCDKSSLVNDESGPSKENKVKLGKEEYKELGIDCDCVSAKDDSVENAPSSVEEPKNKENCVCVSESPVQLVGKENIPTKENESQEFNSLLLEEEKHYALQSTSYSNDFPNKENCQSQNSTVIACKENENTLVESSEFHISDNHCFKNTGRIDENGVNSDIFSSSSMEVDQQSEFKAENEKLTENNNCLTSKLVPYFKETRILRVLLHKLEEEDFFTYWKEHNLLPKSLLTCASQEESKSSLFLRLSSKLLLSSLKSKKSSKKKKKRSHDSWPVRKMRKLLRCPVCKKKFPNEEILSKHQGSRNCFSTYGCSVCSSRFKTKQRLEEHRKSKCDSQKVFKCNDCERMYIFKRSLEEHQTPVCKSLESRYCSMCNKQFPLLKQHMQEVHNTTYSTSSDRLCHFCGKLFEGNQIKKFSKHLLQHSPSYSENCQKYTCAECNCSFSQLNFLKKHLSVHGMVTSLKDLNKEDIENKPHICGKCGIPYRTSHNLKRHLRYCGTIVPLPKVKEEPFLQKIKQEYADVKIKEEPLDAVKKRETFDKELKPVSEVIKKETKPLLCPECGKAFMKQRNLKLHILTHNNSQRHFPCELCDRKFISQSNLSLHKLIQVCNAPSKNFVCSKCGKEVNTYRSLRNHYITHSKIKTYCCKTCNISFDCMEDLRKHLSEQHGKIPIPCQSCDLSFFKKCSLQRHLRIKHGVDVVSQPSLHRDKKPSLHHDKKPSPCLVCGKMFQSRRSVQRHMKTHNMVNFPRKVEMQAPLQLPEQNVKLEYSSASGEDRKVPVVDFTSSPSSELQASNHIIHSSLTQTNQLQNSEAHDPIIEILQHQVPGQPNIIIQTPLSQQQMISEASVLEILQKLHLQNLVNPINMTAPGHQNSELLEDFAQTSLSLPTQIPEVPDISLQIPSSVQHLISGIPNMLFSESQSLYSNINQQLPLAQHSEAPVINFNNLLSPFLESSENPIVGGIKSELPQLLQNPSPNSTLTSSLDVNSTANTNLDADALLFPSYVSPSAMNPDSKFNISLLPDQQIFSNSIVGISLPVAQIHQNYDVSNMQTTSSPVSLSQQNSMASPTNSSLSIPFKNNSQVPDPNTTAPTTLIENSNIKLMDINSTSLQNVSLINNQMPSSQKTFKLLIQQQKVNIVKKPSNQNIVCNLCKENFFCKDDFHKHLLSHGLATTSTSYQCITCGKSFDRKSKYRAEEHLRIHTGELPFGCNQCSKKFRTSSILKTHTLTHQEKNVFQCSVCKIYLSSPYSVRRHLKTVHGIVNPPVSDVTSKTSLKENPVTAKSFLENDLESLLDEKPFIKEEPKDQDPEESLSPLENLHSFFSSPQEENSFGVESDEDIVIVERNKEEFKSSYQGGVINLDDFEEQPESMPETVETVLKMESW